MDSLGSTSSTPVEVALPETSFNCVTTGIFSTTYHLSCSLLKVNANQHRCEPVLAAQQRAGGDGQG